jgi:two-component system sensor histidine kinase BarA
MSVQRFKPGAVKDGNGEGQSILYVEDEDMNWELAEFSLRQKYKLTRAASSREAFSLLSKQKFDLILMDIQLSGSDLSGIEITQILKDRYQGTAPAYASTIRCLDTPIIFVTAYTARYSRDDLRKAGGDELVAKPVDFTRLSFAISRLVLREAVK